MQLSRVCKSLLSFSLGHFRVVNGTMSDTRVARSPRASPDRAKKKAKGRHGGSRTGSGRKFAHEATSAACAAEAKKPGVIGLRAFMGMDSGKRQDAALRQTAKMHKHLPHCGSWRRETRIHTPGIHEIYGKGQN